ncbi:MULTISPECIES: hypothetical protein [unclassified Streptomyces]|uniref:hypothetical protein n=1 Tax=unclassified Streptomyces TaxID=2593676 RepID=UPI0007483733|nr:MULTISPECIES: hypothetical protein [unclassified Streptomyces]KUL72302.1 hypothetical protein ADL33_23150 [Streptomyces sp. NRRL WC-3604]KUL73069.1 hypothetical protein ADL34_21040 [Streptomyces sp. NRRL WC-3605]
MAEKDIGTGCPPPPVHSHARCGLTRHRGRTRYGRAAAALVTAGAFLPLALAPTAGAAEPRPLVAARFVPGPCPATPEPVPGRCGYLEVPENRARRGRTDWLTSATHLTTGVPRSIDALAHGDPVS